MDLLDAEKVINDSPALGDTLPIDSSGRLILKVIIIFEPLKINFVSVDKNHFIRLK